MRDRVRRVRQTNESRAADDSCSSDREKVAPNFGGDANLRESECRVKPRDGRWRRKDEGERAAHSRRFCKGEGNPAAGERNHAGGKPDDERADGAGAVIECGERSGNTDEKWHRVDGEREQQPAEEADSEEAESESEDDHGGGIREIEF